MASTIDELLDLKLYNKQIYLPVNDSNRKEDSVIFLMTPNFGSSLDLLQSIYVQKSRRSTFSGSNNWKSYYMEKDVSYYINNESHKMGKINDQIIEEDGNLKLETRKKGTLSEFKRIEINEESYGEFMNECTNDVIEYFPWTGSFYTTDSDKLVACVNVNIEDKLIQTLFVTDPKYSYLYKELIQEARKLKANSIVLNKNDKAINALTEFGFSQVEDYGEKIKMQFKVPIEEAVKYYGANHELSKYVKSVYKTSGFDHRLRDITSRISEFYAKRLGLNTNICFLMSWTFPIENIEYKLYNDITLNKWMSAQEVMLAITAIQEMGNPGKSLSTIYSRLLNDAELMAHYVDLELAIMESVDWYFDEYEIAPRDYLLIDEVPIIIDYMKQRYGKNNVNDFILKLSYTYYRENGGKVQKAIARGSATTKLMEMYRVRVDRNENSTSADILRESHVTFGYEEEYFEKDWSGYDRSIINKENGFVVDDKFDRGILIRDGNDIKGLVRVNNVNMISEMYCNDISPEYLIMLANRKFLANKACVPMDCTNIIDAFSNSYEWDRVYKKNGMIYFDLNKDAEYIPYSDIGIDDATKDIYNRLDEEAKSNLGNQYLNEVCITNTIYRKVYNEIGLVDLYINPMFPRIGWVDIAVLEDKRKKGYATMMIRECLNYAKKKLDKLDMIGWTCKESNEASYNLALKNGFVPQASKDGMNYLFFHVNTPMSNVFTEEVKEDYNEDMEEWSSRDVNLEEYINCDGSYMLLEEDVIHEMSNNNGSKFRRILWDDRIRGNKQVLNTYTEVKKVTNNNISYTFLNIDLYKQKNLIVDLSFYMNSFENNIAKVGRLNERPSNDLFLSFMKRMLNDSRLNKYKRQTIIIPVDDWERLLKQKENDRSRYWTVLTPMGSILYTARHKPNLLAQVFGDRDVIFISDIGFFFKANFKDFERSDLHKLEVVYTDLVRKIDVKEDKSYTKKGLMHTMLDRLEDSGNKSISIKSIKAEDIEDEDKKKLVKKIDDAASKTNNPEDAAEVIDKEDEYTNKLLEDIVNRESGNQNMSATRSKRMDYLCKQFLDTKVVDRDRGFNGTMKEYMEINRFKGELPQTELPIESINDKDWKHMTFMNFEKMYNLNSDIYKILYFLDSRSSRLSIRGKIEIEDTSTSEDWKETWTVPFENEDGKRFSFKFDLPILKDNRFMVLGGNDKTISGQLILLPVSKTDDDTVQLVSNYNKIFIRRYSVGGCKSNKESDILDKALTNYSDNHNDIKIKYGNSSVNNNHYNLPHDYTDLATKYYSIDTKDLHIDFCQDNIRRECNIKDNETRLPIGWYKTKNNIIWYTEEEMKNNITCSSLILSKLMEANSKFAQEADSIKPAARFSYSKASILATEIPVIIIMAYSEGLQEAMKKGHIEYQLSEKRIDSLKKTHDVIRFKDCYLYYKNDYNASMLMNGLKEVDTKDYSIKETDNKAMWTVFLDDYGGRIKADGLDNFYDLMMDPITVDVCLDYNLPTDYCEMLAYANLLLTDNEYTKHTDITSNRYRSNELIAAHAYKCISKAYASYKIQKKKNRTDAIMTMKQTAILDSLLEDPTMSDLSILNPLLEAEAANTVSFKGVTGMNSDRSYSLDKRTYDPTMINKIALSTGFAGNVGVNRQCTINMQIHSTRGYIKNSTINESTTANTLSMTEALTPFGSTRDDPFRTAMTNIQTSKHNMRIKHPAPLLVSCGADRAIAYTTGDSFAFKAKAPGVVTKMTKDYMVVQYDYNPYSKIKEKYTEIIDLRENIKKNSDGGFYITVKLDTNLKPKQRFKTMDILAYDKQMYSDETGFDNISYCIGALANVAYMNTDEGFEDSAIISDRLSEDLSSEVVVMISKNLPANTNIFKMVTKGTEVQEGDTLLLYQAPFDEEDANAIVKNLSVDKEQITEMGRIPVKSKVTGIVQDIKIYRTVDLSEMSSSLKSIVSKYESSLSDITKQEKLANNKLDIDPTYKLPATSKMKNCEGKVKIEFYLKYSDKMGIGDKLVFMSAVKGETKNIFPKGEEPYTNRVPDEMVDTLCPLPSILHRMVASVKILTGLYKGVIELTRQMKEAVGVKYIPYNPRK